MRRIRPILPYARVFDTFKCPSVSRTPTAKPFMAYFFVKFLKVFSACLY